MKRLKLDGQHGRHNPRATRVAFGITAVGAAVLLAACSSSSSSSGSSAAASSGTSSSAAASAPASSSSSASSGSSGSANISALTADVAKGAAIPTFSTYASGYGSKVSTAGLSGKKIMIVPGDSELAACTEIAQADAALATAAGMKPTIFANQGEESQYNSAVENAIHQGYAAIDLECDFDPTLIAPAIAQAEKAGIVVGVYGATPQESAASKVTYVTVDPYALDAKYAAEQAVAQANGKPFQAIAITSNAAPATAIMQQSLTSTLASICPACKVTDVNVEVPNWTTGIASALSSALLQNPDATVIFPDYAGMLTYVLAGIQSAHKTNSVKTYLDFGGGTPFIKLQTAQPGESIIQSDIGGYPPWTGYLLFLQTVRGLDKMSPIPYNQAIGPDRVATPQNAVNVLTTGGWGTSWVNGFRELLGLPDLSGTALTSASTLGGAMTAAP